MGKKKNKTRLTALALSAALLLSALTGCMRELTEEQSTALVALQNAVTYYESMGTLSDWADLVALAAANRTDGIGVNWNALSLPETPEAPIPADPQAPDGALTPAGIVDSQSGGDQSSPETAPDGADESQQPVWTPVDVSLYPGAVISDILKGDNYAAAAASLASAQNPASGAFTETNISQHIWAMITLNAALGRDGYNYDSAAAYLLTYQREDGGFGYAVDSTASDVELTASASIALAPYYEKNRKTGEMKALTGYYKNALAEDGGYAGAGGETAASIASAISGLIALKQPLPAAEDGSTPLDALLNYQNEDGSFRALKEGEHTADSLSTRQATLALCDVINDANAYLMLADDAESYRIQNISGPAITLNIDYPNGSDIADVSAPFTVEEGGTALDALVLYGKIKEIPVVFTKGDAGYVQSINNISEKEYGDSSGWTFTVNGVSPMQGAALTVLSEGDVLTWTYITNAGSVMEQNGGDSAGDGAGGADSGTPQAAN